MEDDTYWPKFQICAAETACIRLEGITLASVTTTRVEEEEEMVKRVKRMVEMESKIREREIEVEKILDSH